MKFRSDIQSLRGVAVLAVVFFHANSYFASGYLGVDIFFIISGYVVTPLILKIFLNGENDQSKFKRLYFFLVRRFWRLAPQLILVLMVSALLIFLFAPPEVHKRFASQGLATLFLVGNIGANEYSGNYFSSDPNPLVHTWSLSVEEQLFIFLPLFLVLLIKSNRNAVSHIKRTYMFLTLVSLFLFIYPEKFNLVYQFLKLNFDDSSLYFYSTFNRIWQFTLGGVCYFYSGLPSILGKNLKYGLNLLLISILFLLLFLPINYDNKVLSLIVSLNTFFVIMLHSLDIIPNRFLIYLKYFGNRSYSIYLIHMPILYLAKFSPLFNITNESSRAIQSASGVMITFILASLSYSKVENRFRNRHVNFSRGESQNFLITLNLFVAIPSLVFVLMLFGSSNRYWGFERSTLQPLNAALQDPDCSRDNLYFLLGTAQGKSPPCEYKSIGATKTLLLLGDSHAGMLSEAVISVGRLSNWNVVIAAMGGCNVQFKRSVYGQVSDSCLSFNLKMKDWVDSNKPDALIISQFAYKDSLQQKNKFNLIAPQSDLKQALIYYESIIPKILLVGNVPEFPDLDLFMKRLPLVLSPYNPPKFFTKNQMISENQVASEKLILWANQNKIETLNPYLLFCDKFICSRFSDSVWLYRDDDHLSIDGATKLTLNFVNFLK